jgi:hypothetical protein
VVRREIDLAHFDDPPQTSDYLILIESALNKFPKLRDSLAEANADTEPSESRAIVTAPREPANEDPFSLPATLDAAGCEACMLLCVDSDVSTRTELVQVRSILGLARVLEELREQKKEGELRRG